ncbi:hypothetical protein ACVWXN_001773 [Bradyrhizobium sp. i1.4.4]
MEYLSPRQPTDSFLGRGVREVDDVGGPEIHLEALDLVRQLLGAVIAAIRAGRRGEGHKAGDGGGDQDRAADVQFENHDEKPLRPRIQPSSRAERKGCTQSLPGTVVATLRPADGNQKGPS